MILFLGGKFFAYSTFLFIRFFVQSRGERVFKMSKKLFFDRINGIYRMQSSRKYPVYLVNPVENLVFKHFIGTSLPDTERTF